MRPTPRHAALLCASALLWAAVASGADESTMDPTIDGAPRAALLSSVGHTLPSEIGTTEWIVPSEMGEDVSLADFAGEVLVIQSFDTSDTRSRAAMRRLMAAMGTARNLEGVRVIGVHTPENSQTSERIVRSQMKNIPVLVDHDGAWCDELGIYTTPTTILVDRNGVIRHAGIGIQNVREAVTALASEEAGTSTAKPLPPRDQRVKHVKEQPKATSYPAFATGLRGATDVQGKKAPDIAADQWHTPVPNAEGKVVIVEFWATWCGPCIRNIPHMNELANEFRDSVVAIGISDEKPQLVANFVRQRDIDYVIGSDEKRRLFNFAKPRGIPHAWIQSPDGVVRWQGHPANISKELLEQIVEASGAGEGPEETGRWVNP